ncbi:MAG: sulfite exporter TauE/SafE family protein [Acidobacteria bacterium]|nr:sulfite exporter TauE/SafE family protein [Acidobacteriota bacterium]
MPSLRTLLFAALAATTVWFIWAWLRLSKSRPTVVAGERSHTWYHSVVGFVMCFFDTLGIGNFATTTSAFKFRSSIPDEKIPGTLNVGYAIPTVLQALIYISIVEVDVVTLTLMIAASVVGAWLGAGIVARWPRAWVQVGMGFALLAAAGLMLRAQLVAGGATEGTLALQGNLLALGLLGNFALGALMTMGIGLYGPCLILVSLLGMSPSAAFPIMMGSCAFLMPIGGIRFVREGSYAPWTSVVLSLAGLPSVLIAAFIVRSLPLTAVRWLVIVVVVYAAVMMLRSARAGRVPVPA